MVGEGEAGDGALEPGRRTPDLGLLPEIFRRYPDIEAVYLFGSFAGGKTHRDSDLDLAVLPRGAGVRGRKLELLADLARHGFCHVDLSFLDVDDIVFKYEVVRQNRVVYQAEGFDRGGTYSRIVRQYLDFIPYLEVQREAYKRRLLGDQGGSRAQAAEQA